jgi:glycosyltransferase involved in cell wall biosynthesis
VFHLIRAMSAQYDVDVVCLHEGEEEKDSVKGLLGYVNAVKCFSFPKYRYLWNAFRYAAVHRGPLQVGYYWFPQVQEYIDSVYTKYDLIFCFHIRMTEYVKDLPVRKMVDLVDSISMNYERALNGAIGPFWKSIYSYEQPKVLRYEKEIALRFDGTLIIAEKDKEYLTGHGAEASALTVIPNGTDVGLSEPGGPLPEEDIDVMFLGNMETQSNQAAALFFADAVMPIIMKKFHRPLSYYIVGKNPGKEIREIHNGSTVVVTGSVDDPKEYIRRSKIVVAPMLFGAGVQNKILEAMALGKPVVTTSIGAGGIHGEDGVHYRVADSPEAFAHAVLDLLEDADARRTIGEQSKNFIDATYRWSRVDAMLFQEMERCLSTETTESSTKALL